MKMIKLEKIFVNASARSRNIKTFEQLFSQIDISNVKKVLEVGCGIGVLSSYLSEKYEWEVTGIDLDPEQIKKAKNDYRENKYLKFLETDATKLPFGNSEFDLVLSVDALHHIPNRNRAFDEISRVLEPNGFYVLVDIALPRFFGKFSIPVDKVINYMKRSSFRIIHGKKPLKINIIGRRFSIIFQKSPNEYHE
ncbi:MAG: class I SAM-dependent methyltransferase [Methanophagales archaeon]|nr:class I SAM-dependent methyltransferase [Methanophagales archaeon]